MTKAQLLELAAELGIEGVNDSNTKAEIIAAILEAQDSTNETPGEETTEP